MGNCEAILGKNQIGKEFINTFESEYIKKQVEWHFGAAFPGKSRTNNSLESGNNILKIFFQRKPQNIKVFFAKMKDFVQKWSLQEKTTFPNQVEFFTSIKNDALECAKEENFMFHPQTPNLLYYPRKGIPKETLNVAFRISNKKK